MKNYTSPKGVAGFTSLNRADTKYDSDGVYHTKLTFPSREAIEELEDLMKEEALEELGKAKAAKAQYPIAENEDGTVTVKFKSKKAPKFFDGKGNPVRDTEDMNIGGGSVLKIKGAAKAYANGTNIGVTLYINSVQVIKYEEYQAGGGFDADDEAEYVASADRGSKKASKQEEEEADEDVGF
jgi:hypothetical protein